MMTTSQHPSPPATETDSPSNVLNNNNTNIMQCADESEFQTWRINDNLSFALPRTYAPMYYPPPNSDKVKLIGEGAYGCVIAAHNYSNLNGPPVAIKKVASLFTQEPPYLKRVAREIRILKMLRGHPNIVEIQDLFIVGNDLYIVMNMMNTDLKLDLEFGFKRGLEGRYHPEKTKIILYGILKGLDFVHKNNIIHRDLKPGNILLGMDSASRIKVQLCDFGMSNTPHANVQSTPMDSRYVVTRMYRPPEVILESPCQTPAIDIYSVGCIFAEMMFAEQDPPRFRRLFGADGTCSRREVGGELRHLQLITSICGTPDLEDIDGSESAKQILYMQPWFKQRNPGKDFHRELFPESSPEAIALLKSMIHFNPAKRCTVEQALNSPYFKDLQDPFPPYNAAPVNTGGSNIFDFANSIDKFSFNQVKQWFCSEVNPYHSFFSW